MPGDPAEGHDLDDLPEWMVGPETGEKTEAQERGEIARRDNEELFLDGVGPAEMEHEDDSRAIDELRDVIRTRLFEEFSGSE